MGIDPISNVNANMIYAVNAVRFGANHLSEELIKKLKALGIDPSTVKSEEEAKSLIAQAEQKQPSQNTQSLQQAQPQISSPNVDIKQLNDDIKTLGDKLGIDVKAIRELTDVVDRFDVTIKEFIQASSAQTNKTATAQADKAQKGVKISTGAEIVDKPDSIKAEFYAIKERVDKVENSKKSMYAGQDMLAIMNKMSLGL